MSSSFITLMSLLFKSSAKTPSPLASFPENVPSYTLPEPQEGDLDFNIASLQFASCAIFNASSAPFLNSEVTSPPSFVKTLSSLRSEGALGVGKPPSCSGQTGIALPCLTKSITFWQGLALPSPLHFTPAKHALTIIIISLIYSAHIPISAKSPTSTTIIWGFRTSFVRSAVPLTRVIKTFPRELPMAEITQP